MKTLLLILSLAGMASANVKFAEKEICRYVYLRTGKLQPCPLKLMIDPTLGAQEYRITSDTLTGGSDSGVLYGAYRYAEWLGVRFYLHGDVIPDERLKELPVVNDAGKPLFALRGINPWGSHPFGFDAWSAGDYKAVITQLAKMRMNFIGMHCYPEGHPYAEPTVWLGPDGEFDAQGRVKHSYVSRYYNTLFKPAWGGYLPKKTPDYDFGAAQLFEDDAWAPEVMRGHCPEPQTPEACNELFNRMAAQFGDAFTFARALGVKTCLGTEAPITLPNALRDRLKAAGRNPDDPAVKREIYQGSFKRIMAAHPLDYYWIWTEEGWTWGGNKPEQYQAVVADIKLAIEAARNVSAPFQLATCGWVLGPAHDRAALDHDLPKNIPTAAISRAVGYTEVDPAFGKIKGRDTWSIPWLESDGHQGLAGIQLVAGRMRRDAADARKYGCAGLMGLHWRTDSLAPNASALAQAAWDQSWNKADAPLPRALPVDDFYSDFALANFGLAEVGKIFAAIDGKVPLAGANDCPAMNLTPDGTSWTKVAPRYAFVDQFEAFRPQLEGAGNLDRFDYWLNTFKYYRALAATRCAMGANNPSEVMKCWAEAYTCLLATVCSPGTLAMVVNMENKPGTGPTVAKSAGKPFPKEYQGAPRLIVPCVRSVLNQGEALALRILALDQQPVDGVTVHLRPLGKGAWLTIPAKHLARAVFEAKLPAAQADFEYYITTGKNLIWPATAPQLNQTVVVMMD